MVGDYDLDLTYITERRSVELTCATVSYGTDVDPEIVVYKTRAVALWSSVSLNGKKHRERDP